MKRRNRKCVHEFASLKTVSSFFTPDCLETKILVGLLRFMPADQLSCAISTILEWSKETSPLLKLYLHTQSFLSQRRFLFPPARQNESVRSFRCYVNRDKSLFTLAEFPRSLGETGFKRDCFSNERPGKRGPFVKGIVPPVECPKLHVGHQTNSLIFRVDDGALIEQQPPSDRRVPA